MTFRDTQAPIRSIWAAIGAGLALLLAGALSIISVNLFGQNASFAFLPLIVIAIWPRRASEIASVIAVFAAGIFTDWATGGVVGQWALVFILAWMVFRPELRDQPYAFFQTLIIWVMICGLAIVLLSASGWFIYKVAPDYLALGRQVLLATAVLPFILLLRRWLAYFTGDADEWGR
mgnify:CR=1 FL=1